jgi:hypothetical protein
VNNQTLAGAIGAGGLVIQIILGFALSGAGNPTGSALILPHMLIGVGGIALVAFLVSSIFFTQSSLLARVLFSAAFLLTFAQVALGFRILFASDQNLVMAHQGIAIVLLILLALGGMVSARARRKGAVVATKPA